MSSTREIGPAMLQVQRQQGSATMGITLECFNTSITLENVRVAATALKFMIEADAFLDGDDVFPREKEATTSYSKISKGWPPVIMVKTLLQDDQA
ncbi:hypothetical protein FS842_009699 [Serendipita sp. 407]|nr:hypothetical protein FRC15_011840 [Serendipita sp. 397]KAG8819385.1 hypothetical protein FRC18_012103 [Serendipita sp. 400]KAG8860458.1 hypothetical protein FRC20_011609 [Serendipita sp. 405]KAG9052535.1 hypothetical protein FS842_009699 [Serendipita sp. 407]